MDNPIIVALDLPDRDAALRLAEQLSTVVGGFKVGSELFTSAGPEIIARLRAMKPLVFLDLKFHDIPNTVARAVAAAVRLGVQMITVHASGGEAMMQAAEEAARVSARESGNPVPLELGITVLTSLGADDLIQIGWSGDPKAEVKRLALLAARAGLRGMVCSPLEIQALRQALPAEIRLVTPGIRAEQSAGDDQTRTLTAREALAAGADWLVIGRPIYAAADPRAALEAIRASISSPGLGTSHQTSADSDSEIFTSNA